MLKYVSCSLPSPPTFFAFNFVNLPQNLCASKSRMRKFEATEIQFFVQPDRSAFEILTPTRIMLKNGQT